MLFLKARLDYLLPICNVALPKGLSFTLRICTQQLEAINPNVNDWQNVFTLRSFEDSERILAAAEEASRAVVMGSSFISMEAASGLTQRGVEVTVISELMRLNQMPTLEALRKGPIDLVGQLHSSRVVSHVFINLHPVIKP